MRRDLTKALKSLGEQRARLAHDGSAVLRSPANAETRLEARVVTHMISEGLAERVRSEIVRTDAGRAFLRRALTSMPEDAFAEQHRECVMQGFQEDGARFEVATNVGENPLAWLATRKDRSGAPMITGEQHAAGKRLAGDYERAGRRERTTQSWDVSGVRGAARRDRLASSESAHDARRRVETALSAVGPGLADVLFAVCCDEIGLEAVEKRRGWPARSAKVVLKLALDRLITHYGIGTMARGGAWTPTLHWGTDDYCPTA